jgi:hypothetical protein
MVAELFAGCRDRFSGAARGVPSTEGNRFLGDGFRRPPGVGDVAVLWAGRPGGTLVEDDRHGVDDRCGGGTKVHEQEDGNRSRHGARG